jgi:peptidoglycan/xylan/chitin deacetylase (PgdA/CDA1 family)
MNPLAVSRVLAQRAFATPLAWRLSAPLHKRGCLVLTYHRLGCPGDPYPHINANVFRRHMEWIRANCDPIAPSDLPEAAARKARPVLVTFDDAYTDYYDHAYPVLAKLRIPAVCFVATDYVDRRRSFWWDILHDAARASRARRVRLPWGQEFSIDDAHGRAALLRTAKAQIKAVPDRERDGVVHDVLAALGVGETALEVAPSTMTWEQVRSAREFTTFGGHTHTHAIMRGLPADRLRAEVETCRDRLAAETGVRPTVFAYPSGAFDEPAKAAIRDAGFTLGFSTLRGVNGSTTDWLEIRRVHGPTAVDSLAWLMSGITLPRAVPVGHGPF